MSKDQFEEEEVDEMYGICFAEEEKLPMRVILMFHFLVGAEDKAWNKKEKQAIGEIGAVIANAIIDTPAHQEILLPLVGMALVYHSLGAAANIEHLPIVKQGFAELLKLNRMKAEPADVDAFCIEARRMSQRKLEYIHQKLGHTACIKDLKKKEEKTWRAVAKDRLKNKW